MRSSLAEPTRFHPHRSLEFTPHRIEEPPCLMKCRHQHPFSVSPRGREATRMVSFDDLLHRVTSFLPMPEISLTKMAFSLALYTIRSHRKPIHHGCSQAGEVRDRLLLLHDGTVSLDEAIFSVDRVDSTICSAWIRHAIMHKVRLLHICGYCFRLSLDGTTMFPSRHLKTIRFQGVTLKHGLFRPLNYDCPVLEHLEQVLSTFCDHEEISSISLKVLHISHCNLKSGLMICASNLTHLNITETYIAAVVVRYLSSLVTAKIDLSSKRFRRKDKVMDHHLDGLSHATALELHVPLPERASEGGMRTCPMFSNLTRLVLGDWCMTADFYPLQYILQRSDKLKELTLEFEMEECSTCKASSTRRVPLSGSGSYPCIERIKIYCQKDHPRVGELVQALVSTASNAKISIERTASNDLC